MQSDNIVIISMKHLEINQISSLNNPQGVYIPLNQTKPNKYSFDHNSMYTN